MDELIINFIKTYGLPLGLNAQCGDFLQCKHKYGNKLMKLLLISHDHDRLLADRVGDLSGGIGAVLRGILLRGRTCYFYA